jgi:tungstate transport system substrate-binding protein
MTRKLASFLSLLIISIILLTACAPAATPIATQPPVPTDVPATAVPPTEVPPTAEPTAKPAPANPELILATTTSTRDSGLLDVLLPDFEALTGYKVKMVAVGTGQALKMGEEGNADVLLVHAPKSELEYMEKGFGKDRLLVMHNDFVIVGPSADPAGIKGMTSAVEAYQKINETKSMFASRADDSGTHKAELALWKSAEITPEGDWYLQTGQGMGDTLRIASEKGAYTYTDRATYLATKDTLELDVLVEGDKVLLNIYHVITVNPEKWTLVNYEGAVAFAQFMTADDTQEIIAEFGKDKFGEPLFIADAGKAEDAVK